MLRYFIFIEYGLLPDLRVGVLISASQMMFKALLLPRLLIKLRRTSTELLHKR